MTRIDEINEAAAAIYLANREDQGQEGRPHLLAMAQSLQEDISRPALDLVWALSSIDIETHSKDLDADAADVAKTITEEIGDPAACAADIARIAKRHPSEVSFKVARDLLTHAIDQLEERKAG